MSEKHQAVISIICAVVIAVICLAGGPSRAKALNVNGLERFRNEMAADYTLAVRKFLTPPALAKWNAEVSPGFNVKDRQVNHFFAYSMIIPKTQGTEFFAIFFNPWVDGALFTKWEDIDKTWKLANFYWASGERIRDRVTPSSKITKGHLAPIWLWQKGTLLGNISAYYSDMRARLIAKPAELCKSWFSLNKRQAGLDLMRVKLRMGARQKTTDAYINIGAGGTALTGAYSKLKYDALIGDSKALSAFSADGDILTGLKPEIIKSMQANWIFYNNGMYTTLLSSSLAPRYFIFMNSTGNGRITGALLNSLEAMAAIRRTASAKVAAAPPAAPPAASARKVQRYKDASGNQIEIVTEKRDGKVTMTTRKNGKVTEVLNF